MKVRFIPGILFIVTVNSIFAAPFDMMDRNKDGRLSSNEFQGPKPVFKRLDSNGDNYISRKEAIGSKLLQGDGGTEKTPGIKTALPKTKAPLQYIDTHNHFMALYMDNGKSKTDYPASAKNALEAMDRCGVKLNLIMPPPRTLEQRNPYTADELLDTVKKYPDRFAFLGGGGSLNKMIQESIRERKVTGSMRQKFEKTANKWLKAGAVGFGEMTACHLSFNPQHPYIEAPPDHALFLLLSDIAAKNKVPIDLHMEAIPQNMPLPTDFKSPPNPRTLTANIPAFERLLKHNRQTKIIWVHLGWDNTGFRDPTNTVNMLNKHPNLYMSIRIPTQLHAKQTPETSRIVDLNGRIKPEWLEVLEKFPDRFVIGSDEFFMSGKGQKPDHGSAGSIDHTCSFLKKLPQGLEKKIGFENAVKIYNLQ